MSIGKPNIADVLKGYLEDKVKEQLSNDITERLTQEYKRKVREIVDKELESITFDNIDHIRNMLNLSEELSIDISVRRS